VKWVDLVRRLASDHPDALYVEMGPGAVLTGLVRKIAPQLTVMACGTPAEVEQLMQRLT
jgi:[acyl-carrier-protein] S-malonyltransferase